MANDETPGARAPQRVDDPRALRALSHPVRLRILGELAQRSPQNVKMLADRLDEPANSVSYHLSQLVEHGLASRAEAPEGATRRERWFEASSRTGYTLQIRDDTPDQAATTAAVRAWTLQMAADEFDRAVASEPEARRRDLPTGNAALTVWLTPEEARQLRTGLQDLLAPLARRHAEQQEAPRGSEADGLVHYTVDLGLFPDFTGTPPSFTVYNDDFTAAFED